jgi:hypothetical protein
LLLIGEVIKYNTDTLTNPRSIYFNTDKQDSNTNTITMNTNNKNNPHQKNKKNTNTNTNKVTPENDHYAHGSISIKVTDDIQKSRQQIIALLSNKGNDNTHTNDYNTNTNTNANYYNTNTNTNAGNIHQRYATYSLAGRQTNNTMTFDVLLERLYKYRKKLIGNSNYHHHNHHNNNHHHHHYYYYYYY